MSETWEQLCGCRGDTDGWMQMCATHQKQDMAETWARARKQASDELWQAAARSVRHPRPKPEPITKPRTAWAIWWSGIRYAIRHPGWRRTRVGVRPLISAQVIAHCTSADGVTSWYRCHMGER